MNEPILLAVVHLVKDGFEKLDFSFCPKSVVDTIQSELIQSYDSVQQKFMLLKQRQSEFSLRILERVSWIVRWVVELVACRVCIHDLLADKVLPRCSNSLLEDLGEWHVQILWHSRAYVDFTTAFTASRCLLPAAA